MLKKTIFLHRTIYSIMKETFDSVWGSVKDRFTNPFLGTFLFVWLVRNWSLVYGLFIFDEDCTMDDKIKYVKDHFNDYNVFGEFSKNTGITIGLLLIVYIILIGVHYLMRIYKLLISKANARFDKIPVESETHYKMLNTEFQNLSQKYKDLSAKYDISITENQNLINANLSVKNDKKIISEKYNSVAKSYIGFYVKDLVLFEGELFNNERINFNHLAKKEDIPTQNIIDSIVEAIRELDRPVFTLMLESYYLQKLLNSYNDSISNRSRIEEQNEIVKKELATINEKTKKDIDKVLKDLTLIEEIQTEKQITTLGKDVATIIFRHNKLEPLNE